ncbi:glycosyltransferase family 39 protein [Paenibacillus sp. YN15]|uniref:glycosyltransferase family 39 protein n=1 Tax=Paenibacillus sp. YN15 TaxID=1742774 RepID=UPI000DCE6DAB|nr:glycosyltransferase family 39 protein [Paenibacillus sp. YN15]RAV01789.1 4-amino-4-deoxy-L-arabinose transferase [Paenibacillus sp. YN15]
MQWLRKTRLDLPLALIALLAAFLNGYGIWNEQYANSYYTAAVASMLQSFHNFFYGSFDPGGFVTVDKPPVVFWIQTASAALFGVHGWSVILPQALAGVGSVLLMYALVKPTFGQGAARLAALVLACTPIAAAVSRTNNIDSMLVFALLAGTWLLFRGVRRKSLWLLMAAFAVVGLGFNMKMLQAYLVLPAFYLFYLIGYRVNWKKKLAGLAAVTASLLLVSLSWPVIVDMVPADQRPYVGSSQTNSVLELAFGYNGVSRLTGDRGTGGGNGGDGGGGGRGMMNMQPGGGMDDAANGAASRQDGMQPPQNDSSGQSGAQPTPRDGRAQPEGGQMPQAGQNRQDGGQMPEGGQMRQDGGGQMPEGGQMRQDGQTRQDGGGQLPQDGQMNRGGGQGGGMFGTGTKGVFRLFQTELSGQASWMIPFAFIGAAGVLASIRRRNITEAHKETAFWLAWLVPGMIFFSIAGFFHHYYLIMLAPPIAAMSGAGWMELWRRYRENAGWTVWLFPAAVAATAALQWYFVQPYDSQFGSGWSMAVAAAGGAAAGFLILAKLLKKTVPAAAAVLAFLVLLIAPLYWAATPITYGQSAQLPQAGPGTSSRGGGFVGGRGGESASIDEGLYQYLTAHQTGETFLFATTRYNTAVPYIIEKGAAVMAMGGYSGSDPILTEESLTAMVAEGKVKYFLISNNGGPGGGSSGLTQWITSHGKAISESEYGGSSGTLYEVTLD